MPLGSTVPWRRKHLASLRHLYAKAAPAAEILDAFEAALPQHALQLTDASIPTIRFLAERLRVTTPILISSELGLEARFRARFPEGAEPTLRIVAYLEALGATELVEGASGRDYFDVAALREPRPARSLPALRASALHATPRRLRLPPLGDRSAAL